MKKRLLAILLCVLFCMSTALTVNAKTDANNGDWTKKTVVLKNTSEAELSVRVGDIDALNDEFCLDNGYNPFVARDQYAHAYPWMVDSADPTGTDRIYVGSAWKGESMDGYSGEYIWYKNGELAENAFGSGALKITMNYDTAGIRVKNALLQICVDDFQSVTWESNFSVKLNGKDAPFIAEILNHIDQTGPTAYIISAIIPSGFYADIASGKLEITIDETTGCGDGFAVDFAKLLINYKDSVFAGTFKGVTEPCATVRLLGTATTVTASKDGGFEFRAAPGLNAVRASKKGYVEGYDYGIVLSYDTEWEANVWLEEGTGTPDIDFSKFSETEAWSSASSWATKELAEAQAMGLIPDCLKGADMTKNITRAEFAAVSVKLYEALSGTRVTLPADFVNPFTDCNDREVLKAYYVGITAGTGNGSTFSPGDILNREQAATMMTRVFKKCNFEGWTLKTDGNFTLEFTMPESFSDDAKISSWAKDSVYFMASNGIILGSGGKFMPSDTTTAEQALLIAVRTAKNLG